MERPIFFYSEKVKFAMELYQLLREYPQIAGSITFHDVKNGNIPPNVKTVPTILHNGKPYSGVNAMSWINEQIGYLKQMMQQQQQQQVSQVPQAPQQQMPQMNQGANAQQMMQQQQRMAQMNQGQPQMSQVKRQALPTDAIEQPIQFTNDKGEKIELEAYCDENGVCGTDLDLFSRTDEKGNRFIGMADINNNIKGSSFYESINELDRRMQPQQMNQPMGQRR
jgi:hypothetical protein